MPLRLLLIFAALLAQAGQAVAHKASDSYLALTVRDGRIEGQWDVALRDLDFAIGLDTDDDGAITWGELNRLRGPVEAYVLPRLQVSAGGAACVLKPSDYLVDNHTDGAYAVLRFGVDCPRPGPALDLAYGLFFDLDPQHRGLLRVEGRGVTQTAVFSPAQAVQRIELGQANRGASFLQYLREGVWHIWTGYDHILFLLGLLLPAVLRREGRGWRPVEGFRPAFMEVLKVVTAFTVAHSITLSLATLGFIALPSRWVESAIAASVVLAALNNLRPLIDKRRWAVAFGFGLVHGLGFANVLNDLGLPQDALLLALVAFNLGVEAGQLAIVSAFLPSAYIVRRSPWYRWLCLELGSALIALLALVWLAERALDLKLLNG
jgi:hypothetical protein